MLTLWTWDEKPWMTSIHSPNEGNSWLRWSATPWQRMNLPSWGSDLKNLHKFCNKLRAIFNPIFSLCLTCSRDERQIVEERQSQVNGFGHLCSAHWSLESFLPNVELLQAITTALGELTWHGLNPIDGQVLFPLHCTKFWREKKKLKNLPPVKSQYWTARGWCRRRREPNV